MKKSHLLIGIALFVVAFFIRAQNIQSNLFFGFEQGRDAFRIQSILQLEDFVLVGPKTDLDGIFHGPWYYYFMTIPYFLGGGEPLVSSLTLIGLGSLVSVIIYWWWYELTDKKGMAFLAGLIAAVSFELIQYSRWLSNVSPAIAILTMALYLLWKYQKTQKKWFFPASLCLMGLAAQFEIILSLWLVIMMTILIVSRQIVLPKMKILFLGLLLFAWWYLPLLVFNLKYNWQTVGSVWEVLTNGESNSTLLKSFEDYLGMLFRLWNQTVLFIPRTLAALGAILTAGGVYLAFKNDKKKWQFIISLAVAMVLSTVPVIFFSHSLGLIQVYAGIGIGMLLLFLVSCSALWIEYRQKSNRFALLMLIILTGMVLWSSGKAIIFTANDQGTFFRTIQDDLNYHDQRKILEYIQAEAPSSESYFVKAFTIPYYQEEGWQYLHQQKVGRQLEPGAKTIFVIIEEKVDPYWREQWIKDLGVTTVVDERLFGKIVIQKRIRS